MLFQTHQRILHIIYTDNDLLSKEYANIKNIATQFEGFIPNRIGFNFPMNIVDKSNILKKYDVDYVIVYKKGDIATKKHEQRHAMFFLDKQYRESIQKLWNSFSFDIQSSITNQLIKMNYPNNMAILLDEFQAYYFTEKKNFFGKFT